MTDETNQPESQTDPTGETAQVAVEAPPPPDAETTEPGAQEAEAIQDAFSADGTGPDAEAAAEAAAVPGAEAQEPSEAQVASQAEEAPSPEAEAATSEDVTAEAVPEADVSVAQSEDGESGVNSISVDGPTMAELLDAPENEVKSLKHGDVVEGTVVRIDPDEILVDFGGKSEGVVSNRELMSRRGARDGDEARPELKVGDEVLVYVLQPESPEGHAVLSLRRAGLERKWRAMQERFDAGEIVEARVIDHNKGGLIVDLGVRGFVPISQIVDFPRRPRDEQPRDAAQEIAEKLQPFVGRTLRLKILEVNRKANRLILSEKVALYEERREKRDELFSSLQVGQRVQGTVRSIAPFGVFVDLGGIDGLVHKSELSWNKVNNPETAYAIGDEVEAEVIDINHERGRISLSIRRLQPDPWQESVAKYKIGDVIGGTVTKLVNFGAFVRVEEGLEGLIHISELSNQRVAHPGDVVKEGEELRLKIISLDSERHRLGLSLKQAEERPAAATAAAQPRYEERPQRRERRERRERFRPEDAVSEPDEGIDNTMAAAFAESGLLDQFRRSDRSDRRTRAEEPDEGAGSDEQLAGTGEDAMAEEVSTDATATAEAAATEEESGDAAAEPVSESPAEGEAPAVADAPVEADVTAEADAPAEAESAEAEPAAEANPAAEAEPAEVFAEAETADAADAAEGTTAADADTDTATEAESAGGNEGDESKS